MKVSLRLGERRPLSRQTAWGCFTSNLAFPGSGSLAAGRRSGYPQLLLTFAGLILSMVFGVRFVLWSLGNWGRLHDLQMEPTVVFGEMWRVMRWALLGLATFGFSLLWALATSLQILRSAKEPEQGNLPPRLS
jgi:hypothetical protein